jgi:hypothetical protein
MKRVIVFGVALLGCAGFAGANTISNPTIDLPVTSVSSPGYDDISTPYTGAYEVIYVDSTTGTQADPPYYYEFRIVLSGPYSVVLTDQVMGTNGVTLSDAEFFTSQKMIPLGDLNTMDYPPSSPLFSPLPGADGTYPGNSPQDEQTVVQNAVSSTPLPTTAWALPILLAGLAGVSRFKRTLA